MLVILYCLQESSRLTKLVLRRDQNKLIFLESHACLPLTALRSLLSINGLQAILDMLS